jgi:hypothetical protein
MRMREYWQIQRPGPVNGMAIPIFIHNGHLFLTDLGVFADGLVDCWGMVDMEGLQVKLREGWVRPEGFIDLRLSIHGLGAGTIESGRARLTEEILVDLIEKMVGILQRVSNVPIEPGGDGGGTAWGFRAYREDENGQPIWAEKLTLFSKIEEGYKLVHWFIYADGYSHLDMEDMFPLEQVIDTIRSGSYTCKLPDGAELELGLLGSCRLVNGNWQVELEDRIGEARDLLCQLQSKPGLVEQCRQRFQEYLEQPDASSKRALLRAYEAVPSHKREFCGDMDVQDIPIRMALYGRQEIERWSHRRLARQLGDEDLPEIDVPILAD